MRLAYSYEQNLIHYLLMVTPGGLDLLARTEDPSRRQKLKAGIRQTVDRGLG